MKTIAVGLVVCCAISFELVASEFPDTIQTVKRSIVGVGTYQNARTPPAQLLGTGFVIGDGLHVITNAHVLNKQLDSQHNEHWAIFVGQGLQSKTVRATIQKSDVEHDLVLLRLFGNPLPALNLDDSEKVREGERFAFTGFPIGAVLGLYPVTHSALVSAITPVVIPVNQSSQLNPEIINRLRSPFTVFQLDATAYPGNSGSPLFRMESGLVVGVVNMVFVKESKENLLSNPSGIAYAIPSSHIKQLVNRDD